MTQEQKTQLERAIEIAKEKGHKVFTATHRATGATVYTVRSHSDKNLFHVLYIEAGRIHCDCYCSQQDRICSHSAAVRLFLIAQRDALASIEQAEQPAAPSAITVMEEHIELLRADEQERDYTEMAQQETELQQALREQQEYNALAAEKLADFWKNWKSLECKLADHARCLKGCPCTCACHESQDDYEQSKAPEGFPEDEEDEYKTEVVWSLQHDERLPLCEMCQEAPAVHYAPQLRCAACLLTFGNKQSVTAGDIADATSPERESGLEWETGSSLPLDRPTFTRSPLGLLKI